MTELQLIPNAPPETFPYRFEGDRLVLAADIEPYRPVRFSPSAAEAFKGCSARYMLEKALPDEMDLFSPAPMGTAAHAVLEQFYELPVAKRTPKVLKGIVVEDASEFFPDSTPDTEPKHQLWIDEVWDRVVRIGHIENPQRIIVRRNEWQLNTVELVGIPFNGFVDRTDFITPDDFTTGTKVIDYKAGAKKSFPAPWGDAHGDQIRLYVAAIGEIDGRLPLEGWIYYTRLGATREIRLTRFAMEATLEKFSTSWERAQREADEGAWGTETGPLCGWCPAVTCCPAAADDNRDLPRMDNPEMSVYEIPVAPVPVAFTSRDERSGVETPDSDDVDVDGIEEFIDTDAELVDLELTSAHALAETDLIEIEPVEPVDTEPEPIDPADLAEAFAETRPASRTAIDPTYIDGIHPWIENEGELTMESKPWEPMNEDGTMNPASYAAMGAFGITTMAVAELDKADVAMNPAIVKAFAETVASIVESVQHEVFDSTSLQNGANTRIRGAMYTTLSMSPPPFGGTTDEWASWVAVVTRRVTAISKVAVDVFYSSDRDAEPWRVLASDADDDAFDGVSDDDLDDEFEEVSDFADDLDDLEEFDDFEEEAA